MKTKHFLSMLVMTLVVFAGVNLQVAEANSPATVRNFTQCAFNITYVTDQGTVFGPQFVGPGGSYDIKVPTGESIARIVINGQRNNPNIAIGSCAALNSGPAICIGTTPPTRFCRRAAQVWGIR